MDWLILILGVPAVLIPLVLLFGFAGCHPATPCYGDEDCPGGIQCVDGSCVEAAEPDDDPDTPPPPPPVSAPRNLSAIAIDDHSVLLTWSSNEPGATFQIDRADEDGIEFTLLDIPPALVSPAGTTDDTPGLLEGVTFLYRVSAMVDGQTSQPSDISSATVLPATPVSLRIATPASFDRIDLAWTNASTVATEFSLERRVLGGAFAPIGPARVAGTTFSDTIGLSEGTTYEYQVFAVMDGFVNSVQQPVKSLPSATAQATTLAFTTAFTGTLTTDQPGGEGVCLVLRLSQTLLAPNVTGTQVRITLRGSTAGSLTLDNVFISQVGNTGDPYDAASDLTFVASGVTIPANNPVTLPPVNYTLVPTQDLLVAFDISSTANEGNLRFGPLAGVDQFAGVSTAEAGVQDRTSGYQGPRPNTLFLIEKIEVL